MSNGRYYNRQQNPEEMHKTFGNQAQNELQSKIKFILHHLQQESLNHTEFMRILNYNNIRLYQKDDLKKSITIFNDAPNKTLRKELPFTCLRVVSVQLLNTQRYQYASSIISVTKFNSKSKCEARFMPNSDPHDVLICLKMLINLLYRHYGTQNNWFKALGGLIISVSIEITIFEKKIANLLKKTNHKNCVSEIVDLFREKEGKGKITWSHFTKMIQHYRLLISSPEQKSATLRNFSTDKPNPSSRQKQFFFSGHNFMKRTGKLRRNTPEMSMKRSNINHRATTAQNFQQRLDSSFPDSQSLHRRRNTVQSFTASNFYRFQQLQQDIKTQDLLKTYKSPFELKIKPKRRSIYSKLSQKKQNSFQYCSSLEKYGSSEKYGSIDKLQSLSPP